MEEEAKEGGNQMKELKGENTSKIQGEVRIRKGLEEILWSQ